jgi:transposase-like protein
MAKALQLVDEGVDRGCIAERLGVKRGTVNDWVRNRTKEAAGGNDGDA